MTCPFCGGGGLYSYIGGQSQFPGYGGLGQQSFGCSMEAARVQALTDQQLSQLRGLANAAPKSKKQLASEYAAEVRKRKPEMQVKKEAKGEWK